MPKSLNPHIESWAREFWESAVAAPSGIEFEFYYRKEAESFRFGLYRARNVDRELNKEIYPPGEELHGKSLWDSLTIKIAKSARDTWLVTVIPTDLAAPRPKAITLL